MILDTFSSPSLPPCPPHWQCWRQIRGAFEEKVACVYFCWFHVNCSDLGNVFQNMEKASQKHQTTTQNHVINHQNLDVHDFIQLVISSSLFSKNCWLGLPNYSRVWGVLPSKLSVESRKTKKHRSWFKRIGCDNPEWHFLLAFRKPASMKWLHKRRQHSRLLKFQIYIIQIQENNLSGLKAQTSSQNIRIHDRFNKNLKTWNKMWL